MKKMMKYLVKSLRRKKEMNIGGTLVVQEAGLAKYKEILKRKPNLNKDCKKIIMT